MFGEQDFEQQLAEARAALGKAMAARGERPDIEASGEAAEGRIRVRLDGEGRVEEFTLEPRVLTEGSEYVAEELRKAVNQALAMRESGMATDEPMPDLEAMNATLQAVQDRGMAQMRAINNAIAETMRKIHRD